MSIVTGIQTGIVSGIRTGINGYWGPRFISLDTAAKFAAATGVTLSSLYLCEDASGALTDSEGTEDLTAGGTPNYQVASPWAGKVGIGFDDLSADHFVGGAGTFADDGATSFLFVEVCKWDAAPTGTQMFGRYIAGDRYTMSSSGGSLVWNIGDGTLGGTATLSADHDGLTFAYAAGINRNNATAWVCSPLGRAELDITGYGTIAATAAAFRFGHWSTASTTGRSSYLFGYGSGASTELTAAQQTAFVATLNQGI